MTSPLFIVPSIGADAGDDHEPPPPDVQPGVFKHTDTGNAERLVHLHGASIRYVPTWDRWLTWDGQRWEEDSRALRVRALAKDTVRAMWAEAVELSGGHRDDLLKWAAKSESSRSLEAIVNLARVESGVAITPAQLNADPMLLAVDNGVIDLRTGRLAPHDRDQLITKLVPITYDPDAPCDRWELFLRQVLGDNADMIQFLQRAVGYSLTGQTGEQCLFFLYGAGANGKSTFLEVLRQLLAEYSTQADFTTFIEKKGDGPRNDIARLFSARVVTSSEVGEGKRFNESLVKTLTGDDMVAARYLYAEAFEYKPTFKLWLAANHRPIIRGTDNAIWRRIRMVPFTVQIPEADRDPNLKHVLRSEMPGILAWAVAGCLLWQQKGLGAPDQVTAATDAYRRESDTLGAFLEDCCDIGAEYSEPSTDLYLAYKRWAEEGGEFVMSQTRFGRDLEERGISVEKRGQAKMRKKWRVGIRLNHKPLPNNDIQPVAQFKPTVTQQTNLYD